MRVQRLSFAAIGPFAGEHVIDFDALGGSSLFLIDGPTGAGKSSLIDALVFAMFGDVAGRESDRQRLRSSFAPASQESYAEVEFTCSAGQFKVRRTPEYQRPSKRGDGLVAEASSVRLWRSTGAVGWELMSSKRGEADGEIVRLVGLTRAQFLQTVVLPQGEFASFLSAESRDRQAVLERIFNTSIYSRIESILDERRKSAQAARESAGRAVADALQRLRGRLGDQAPESTDDEEVLLEVGALLDRLGSDVVAAQESVAALEQAVGSLDRQLAMAREREAAERALQRAQQNLAQADATLQQARERASAHLVDTDVPAELLASMDEQIGALRILRADEESVAGMQAQLDADLQSEVALLADIDALRHEQQVDLPARVAVLASALAHAVAQAQASAEAAAEREAALTRARLEGMSAELALGLAPDQPCPVCGSREHPAPTVHDGPAVSAADIAQAAKERDRAQHRWHEVSLQQASLGTPGGSPAEADVSLSPEEIAEQARAVERRAEQITGQLSDLGAKAAAIQASNASASAALAELRARVGEAAQGSGSVQSRLEELTNARAIVNDLVVATAERATRADQVREAQVPALAESAAARASTEEVQERVRETREALTAAASERDRVSALRMAVHGLVDEVMGAITARDEAHAATADVMRLAALVKGSSGNQLAQPLSAYVVQTMFDEILVAANVRLGAMLEGRFELVATEERVGRAHMGQGLGLMVRDLRTDSLRRCSTMSGGETFCASLALALGLADIVTANAGGVDIGLLLIDEGFGSLDGDRLDDVMSELLALKRGGRTVGVISHVSEMKKSINERIDVRPLGPREGSTLKVSWEPGHPA